MEFSSLQENLKQGLFATTHVAGKNVNLPILNNVLIEAKEGDIRLITTDLEMGVLSKVRGKTQKPGAFTVDSKIISDFIGLLPNKKVNIKHKNQELLIECENYKTKIKGQTIEEFPLIPKVDRKNGYIIKTKELKHALSQIVFAVSTSESRLELTGAQFSFEGNRLTVATTDSYRLAERQVDISTEKGEGGNNTKSVIVPAKTLQEVIRIISGVKEGKDDTKEETKIFISENQILFATGSTELVSRLIEGQYPDYQQIIPDHSKTRAQIRREELIRAVKAAALFSKTGINDINLDFPQGKNTVVVSSASGQTGENVTTMEAKVDGSDNGVVVNYRYLLDGLNNIASEDIALEIVDSNTPCTLKPVKQDNYIYIIMPIKQ